MWGHTLDIVFFIVSSKVVIDAQPSHGLMQITSIIKQTLESKRVLKCGIQLSVLLRD